MEEVYLAKYKTGKMGLMIFGSITIINLFLCIIMMLTPLQGLPLAIATLIFFGGCFYFLLNSYREVLLYQNKLVVTSVIDGVIVEIHYADITHVGFLHGAGSSSASVLSRDTGQSRGDLIILMQGGRREQLSDDDYNHLGDVCGFIQRKICENS